MWALRFFNVFFETAQFSVILATPLQPPKRNERTKLKLARNCADSRTLKRKNGMRLSSAAGRLQLMRARRPTPFSRGTSEDCGIRPRARRPRRNSCPTARTRAVKSAHLESERQGPTRVCQAPQIDTSSCPCHADNISISGWRPETPL